jgi:pantoate--beta-alanine ligase
MLVKTIEEVKKQVSQWKKEGLSVGFVPTMGALHEGHMSLIKKSAETCDKTIVSVFVNPTQFGPSEDFSSYPRTLENDYDLSTKGGANLVFAPSGTEMYGEDKILSNDFLTYVVPPYFFVDKLCAKTRTGHFDGVCTVVTKLFNIVQPDYAFFGQKDAQQLIIIEKMVRDLNIPVGIVSCPIVRDENGLALSSRNKNLSEYGKKEALALSKILFNIKSCYQKGITEVKALSETALSFLNENHELEYLEFVDKISLETKTAADENTLVLIAVKVENVRLIDNCFMN